MDAIELQKKITAKIMTTRIVWFALLNSIFVYVGLGYYLKNMAGFATPPQDLPNTLPWALMFVGIITASAGVVISSGAVNFPPMRGDTFDARYVSAQAGMILSWALCESAAVVGLVLFFLFRSFTELLLMAAVSAVGMIVSFPTSAKFASRIGNI